jgi:hypothetical protein
MWRSFIITVWFVLLLISCALPQRQWIYRATYCEQRDCPTGGKEIQQSGVIYDKDPVGCPSVVNIILDIRSVGRAIIVDDADYYFKPGTCEVIAYEDSRSPRIMSPDKTTTTQ